MTWSSEIFRESSCRGIGGNVTKKLKHKRMSATFDSCLDDGEENFTLKDNDKIFFTGISCLECLKSDKTARLRTIVHHREQRNIPNKNLDLLIEVNFKCEMFSFTRHFY